MPFVLQTDQCVYHLSLCTGKLTLMDGHRIREKSEERNRQQVPDRHHYTSRSEHRKGKSKVDRYSELKKVAKRLRKINLTKTQLEHTQRKYRSCSPGDVYRMAHNISQELHKSAAANGSRVRKE